VINVSGLLRSLHSSRGPQTLIIRGLPRPGVAYGSG